MVGRRQVLTCIAQAGTALTVNKGVAAVESGIEESKTIEEIADEKLEELGIEPIDEKGHTSLYEKDNGQKQLWAGIHADGVLSQDADTEDLQGRFPGIKLAFEAGYEGDVVDAVAPGFEEVHSALLSEPVIQENIDDIAYGIGDSTSALLINFYGDDTPTTHGFFDELEQLESDNLEDNYSRDVLEEAAIGYAWSPADIENTVYVAENTDRTVLLEGGETERISYDGNKVYDGEAGQDYETVAENPLSVFGEKGVIVENPEIDEDEAEYVRE